MEVISLLKKGNKSSAAAAIGNTILAIVKGIAAFLSGSGTMFATTLHSLADATNQGFVFFGSALAEKEPTKRFPAGFGRVVNLFVLVAVMIISVMAYESIISGWDLIRNPEPSSNFWLNVLILFVAICVDGFVLIKAMKEIKRETDSDATGLQVAWDAYRNVKYAAPPTRLVFYEDNIATFGTMLALLFVILAHFTGLYFLDGLGSLFIGILLLIIALKIGYENTMGLIGVAAPKQVENRIAKHILNHPDVVDIKKMRIIQEGRLYHVESYIELRKGLTLDEADDIKDELQAYILEDKDVGDATIGLYETDDEQDWRLEEK
ncbi:cation diffusion facilitator family transporter [Aliibacillus thermotolerans]|uniref:Cation diffusion facilitator family transporter n=1 Tax=Aliibacillus thermotolerans TaxID=1834418 RepID=A0ABW0U5M7_9BACI|nr:cation diffusion facilitator family transporter [Aliibacillus thermotolerans]MDA3129020.1 cation diffusion facilitator family transporter [Aliibacillus thermotolerans]